MARSFINYGNVGPAAIPVTLNSIQPDLVSSDGIMLMGMGSGLNTAFFELQW